MNANEWKSTGTVFSRFNAPRGEPRTWTWADVGARLSQPQPMPLQGKDALPLWSFAVFTEHYRGLARHVASYAVVLDLDAKRGAPGFQRGDPDLNPDRLAVLMESAIPGVAWWAHTSPSSNPEGDGWRWRVIVPLSAPVNAADYSEAANALRVALMAAGSLAAEADTGGTEPHRAWYGPAKVEGLPYEVRGTGGVCWTPPACLGPSWVATAGAERSRREQTLEWRDQLEAASIGRAAEALVNWLSPGGLSSVKLPWPGAGTEQRQSDGGPLEGDPRALQVAPDGYRGPSPAWSSVLDLVGPLGPNRNATLIGPPGAGKTAFAVQVLEAVARHRGPDGRPWPVLYVAAELDPSELAARLLAIRASGRVKWSDVLGGRYSVDAVIGPCADLVNDCPELYVWHPPRKQRNPEALGAMARALVDRCPGRPPLIVVDYVQRMVSGSGADRRVEVAEIAEAIRGLSRPGVELEHGAAVLALSSTARKGYSERGGPLRGPADLALAMKRDPLSVLGTGKESGDVEYDAAVVLALAVDHEAPRSSDGTVAGVLAAPKIRRGRPGWVALRFDGATGTWSGDPQGRADIDRRVDAMAKGSRNGSPGPNAPKDPHTPDMGGW